MTAPTTQAAPVYERKSVPLRKLVVLYPRERDPKGHAELTQSIARFGQLYPALVQEADGGKLHLLAGQGRKEALEKLGRTEIDALVFARDAEIQPAMLNFVENEFRRRLPADTKARLIEAERLAHPEITMKELGARFGITEARISQVLKALRLADPKVRQAFDRGEIDLKKVEMISRAPREAQKPLLKVVKESKERVTVHDVAALSEELDPKTLDLDAIKERTRELNRRGTQARLATEHLERRLNALEAGLEELRSDEAFVALARRQGVRLPGLT